MLFFIFFFCCDAQISDVPSGAHPRLRSDFSTIVSPIPGVAKWEPLVVTGNRPESESSGFELSGVEVVRNHLELDSSGVGRSRQETVGVVRSWPESSGVIWSWSRSKSSGVAWSWRLSESSGVVRSRLGPYAAMC